MLEGGQIDESYAGHAIQPLPWVSPSSAGAGHIPPGCSAWAPAVSSPPAVPHSPCQMARTGVPGHKEHCWPVTCWLQQPDSQSVSSPTASQSQSDSLSYPALSDAVAASLSHPPAAPSDIQLCTACPSWKTPASSILLDDLFLGSPVPFSYC